MKRGYPIFPLIFFLPTYTSQKALEHQAVRPIEFILSLPEEATLISDRLEQEIEHLEGRSNKAFRRFSKGSDYRCHLEWIIKKTSDSEVEVTVCFQRAGTMRTRFCLK